MHIKGFFRYRKLLILPISLAFSSGSTAQTVINGTSSNPTVITDFNGGTEPVIISNSDNVFGFIELNNSDITLTSSTAFGTISLNNNATLRIGDASSTADNTITIVNTNSSGGFAISSGDNVVFNVELGSIRNGMNSDNPVNLTIADDVATRGISGAINITTSTTTANIITFRADNQNEGRTINFGGGTIILNASDDLVIFSGSQPQEFSGDIRINSSLRDLSNRPTVAINNSGVDTNSRTVGTTIIGDIGTSSARLSNLIIGSTDTNSASRIRGNIYADIITFGGNNGDFIHILEIEAQTNDLTISGALNATESDDTVRLLVNDNNTTQDTTTLQTVTFSSPVGGTTTATALDIITVGFSTSQLGTSRAGSAVFIDSVRADRINISGFNNNLRSQVVFHDDVTVLGDGGIVLDSNDNTLTDNESATVIFNGVENQVVNSVISVLPSSNINENGNGVVRVANTGGTVTFMREVGMSDRLVGSLILENNTRVTFTNQVIVSDLQLQGGAATFNQMVLLDNSGSGNGSLSLLNGTDITVGGNTSRAGQTVISTNSATDSGTITITINNGVLSENQSLTLISASGGTLDATYNVNSNTLLDFEVTRTSTTVTVTASSRPPCDFSPELGITFDTGFGLLNAYRALDDGSMAQIALNTALNTDVGSARQAANQVALQTDMLAAIGAVSVDMGNQVAQVTSARLASLRTGSQYVGKVAAQGFSAGDISSGRASIWLRPFAGAIDQKARNNGREGYNARTSGITGGWEIEPNENTSLGVAFSYADTDVDGKGDGNAQLGVDSYQATLYGDITKESHYIEWYTTYARNHHNTQRLLTFGGLNTVAQGSFHANQFGAGMRFGKSITWIQDKYVTPHAGLSVTHLIPESYTETGAGELNLSVNPEPVTAIVGTVGVKVHEYYQTKHDGVLAPFIHSGINIDFLGDELSATGRFTGGGDVFKAYGTKVEPFGGYVGLGVHYEDTRWSFNAKYDFDWRPGQIGGSASLEAKMKF